MNPADSPEISIVIVSYNVWNFLAPCIHSIKSQKNIRCQIIIVDNNSTDSTVENLQNQYPSIKLISNKFNLGFSAANNQGIKEATSEIILLLNPDTELISTDTLQKIKNCLVSNDDIGIIAPQLINSDGTFQNSFWNFPRLKDICFELFYLHLKKKKNTPSYPIQVDAVSGAAICLKKELVCRLGGFDSNMFWMEDIDLCYRATQNGKKVIYYPDVKIVHYGGKSSFNNYSITIPNQLLSKIKYFRKNGSYIQFIGVEIVIFLFIITRIIAFTILSFRGNTIYHLKSKAYFHALVCYLKYNFTQENGIAI